MDSHRFSRITRLLGPESVQRLSTSFVVIVGIGAVGSYAMETLARSGVGHFRVVDFDTIGITNINRQLLALDSTIGIKKSELARARILDINPQASVEALDLFANHDTLDRIMEGNPDVVVDAIDALAPKLALLEEAWKRKCRIVSSMGAALRTDATAIKAADLMDTTGCPLAKQVRSKLRRRGVDRGILAVYSDEPVSYTYLDPDNESDTSLNEQILDKGRRRMVLGSLPSITGMFGLRVGHEVLRMLLKIEANRFLME